MGDDSKNSPRFRKKFFKKAFEFNAFLTLCLIKYISSGVFLQKILDCEKTMKIRKVFQMAGKQQNDQEIITFVGQDGTTMDMILLASYTIRGTNYAVMRPVELLEGMTKNDVLVFRVTVDEDGDDSYQLEENDKVSDEVVDRYNRDMMADGSQKPKYWYLKYMIPAIGSVICMFLASWVHIAFLSGVAVGIGFIAYCAYKDIRAWLDKKNGKK